MDLNPASLRARFAELGDQRAGMLAVSAPLRDQRDTIAHESQSQIAALDRQIEDAEAGLFDLDQERALIARALGGKTGTSEA